MAQRAFKVTGDRGVLANIYARQKRIQESVRAEVRQTGADWLALARRYAPKDEGTLEDSLTVEMSPSGNEWTGFHDPSHYPGENYGDFQELGFRHHLSGEFIQNPHMYPAFREIEETAGARLGEAVRRELR